MSSSEAAQPVHRDPSAEPGFAPVRRLEAELGALFLRLAARADLDEKGAWLEPLVTWLRKPGRVLLPAESGLQPGSPAARLWVLLRWLRARPAEASRLGQVLRSLVAETTAVHLFAGAGMGGKRSFGAEALHRATLKVLPAAPNDRQLEEVLALLFPSRRSAAWLAGLPEAALQALWALLFVAPVEPPWHLLRSDMADAVCLLGGRASALGLEHEVRVRSQQHDLRSSPFFLLPELCRTLADHALRTRLDVRSARHDLERAAGCLAACRQLLTRAFAHQEQHGVSVDLVYRLELIGRQLDRLELLFGQLFAEDDSAARKSGRTLLAHLVAHASDDRSLRLLLRRNVHQLARKIVESASSTGEHYIAKDRSEYRAMLLSAAGGGMLTAATTMIKYGIAGLPVPPFVAGVLSSANYAASFLLIYFLGWTLATKQPAATAATLANAMRRLEDDEDRARVVEQIAETTRSQLAAVAGNLGTVIPAAIALDFAWRFLFGHHFFDRAGAEHALQSLHPVSGVVLYAALTGALLWLSSVGAGWVENWSNFHRLPEGIAKSRGLLRLLGPERRARLGAAIQHNAAPVAGNVILGALLGMAPFVGAFFGLPTEIRHVTLSTGLLSLGATSLGAAALSAPFLWAVTGIAVIALLNFTVSFSLALWLASRACGVERQALLLLGKTLLLEGLRHPGRFLLPPPPAASTLARPA